MATLTHGFPDFSRWDKIEDDLHEMLLQSKRAQYELSASTDNNRIPGRHSSENHMKIPFPKHLAWAALALGSIGATKAAVVTEYPMNFLAVAQNGTMLVNGATGGTWNYFAGYDPWVGDRSNPNAYASIGLVFYLPTLAPGEAFSTFEISLNQYSKWDDTTMIDLYGLGTSATQSPSSIPYYAGLNDTAGGVTKLQSAYLTSVSSDYTLAAWTSSVNIASYVNGLYSGGVPTENYLMIRLSAQDEAAGLISTGSYSMLTGADPAANPVSGVFTGAPQNWPQNYASYNVVPEPATWALLAGGAGMLVMFRRRA